MNIITLKMICDPSKIYIYNSYHVAYGSSESNHIPHGIRRGQFDDHCGTALEPTPVSRTLEASSTLHPTLSNL